MPRLADEELEAIQVRLFTSDLAWLRANYASALGVNKAIRSIVRSFRLHAQAQADKAIDKAEVTALVEE